MRSNPRPPGSAGVPPAAASGDVPWPARTRGGPFALEALAPLLVVLVTVVLWLPRQAGPIDLRWDGGVYYLLGTSLAEGRGYRLLNEPGEIEGVQYPPLLPAVVAAHQRALGTSDPTIVGRWLRLTSFLVFVTYGLVALWFLRSYLPSGRALLGALLSVFCLHAWFLSDALFPEVSFSVATVLFLIFARRQGNRAHSALAYVCALASYALRTVGIAAFAVWVLDSLIRRRFREALIRTLLVLLPVVGWHAYVASVERSEAYKHPAYDYQRAPYMFYNVSYARNVVLRDPFTPEKGPVQIPRRIVRNALDLPVHFGETLSASRGYFQMCLHWLFAEGPIADRLIDWGVFILLSAFGGVLVTGGVVLLLVRRQPLVPLYVLTYSAAMCLTPFPGQYARYLMPIVPLLALSAVACLDALTSWRRPTSERRSGRRMSLTGSVLGTALLIQVIVTVSVYAREYRPIAYVDARGEAVAYKLFFYNDSQRGFDEAIDYLRAHAAPTHVVAAGTPHWIHLRTGLKAVMPPFERDVDTAQRLLDSVPVRYLVIGRDVVATERYTIPVVRRFAGRWQAVHATAVGGWTVYRRGEP